MDKRPTDRKSAKTANNPKDLRVALSHDYKIPGISPKLYVPLFLIAGALYIVMVPGWYLPGNDFLFFLFLVFTASVISTASRFLKYLRKR